jgi:hypothetical protein
MSTLTSLLSLLKPDGADLINVQTALNNNLDILDQAVLLTASQTLTNKTINSPSISSPTFSGTVTLTSPTISSPTFSGTISGIKTGTGNIVLSTSPSITTATLTEPTISSMTVAATDWSSANHAHAAGNSGGTIAYSAITGTPTWTTISGYPGSTGTGVNVLTTSPTLTRAGLTNPIHNGDSNHSANTTDITNYYMAFGTGTFTLPAPGNYYGTFRIIKAYGGGATIATTSGGLFGPGSSSSASFAITAGDSLLLWSDGNNWWVI